MWKSAQGHSTRGDGAAKEVKARRAQPISSQEPEEPWLGLCATLRVKIHLSGAASQRRCHGEQSRLGGKSAFTRAHGTTTTLSLSIGRRVASAETSASNFKLAWKPRGDNDDGDDGARAEGFFTSVSVGLTHAEERCRSGHRRIFTPQVRTIVI